MRGPKRNHRAEERDLSDRPRPRDILAANPKSLMSQRPDLDTLPKITAVTGVPNGTLDRVRRAASALRIDDLDRIGAAFGLQAWELLLPPAERAAVHHMLDAARALHKN